MKKWVIYGGDPFDGARLIGPFASPEDAHAYIERHGIQGNWNIVELEAPLK